MNLLQIFVLFCAVGSLTACNTTTTPPLVFAPALAGTAANNAGTYSVTEGGTVTTMPGAPANFTTPSYSYSGWSGGSSTGFLFENSDVTAIAGMDANTFSTFAGISGTASASLPASGNASYTGAFLANYFRQGPIQRQWFAHGTLTTNVDFGSGKVIGSGSGSFSSILTVNGDISGTKFNGTAQFSALESGGSVTVPLTGGFYGANTLAGIFKGDTVAGIIHGQ